VSFFVVFFSVFGLLVESLLEELVPRSREGLDVYAAGVYLPEASQRVFLAGIPPAVYP
jgi:hypothetical protein